MSSLRSCVRRRLPGVIVLLWTGLLASGHGSWLPHRLHGRPAQLEDLLGQYLRKAGDRASLRDFHDRLLSYGTTPLAIVAPELLADLDKPADAVRAAANY